MMIVNKIYRKYVENLDMARNIKLKGASASDEEINEFADEAKNQNKKFLKFYSFKQEKAFLNSFVFFNNAWLKCP